MNNRTINDAAVFIYGKPGQRQPASKSAGLVSFVHKGEKHRRYGNGRDISRQSRQAAQQQTSDQFFLIKRNERDRIDKYKTYKPARDVFIHRSRNAP